MLDLSLETSGFELYLLVKVCPGNMNSFAITKEFPFSIRDIETMPTLILRNLGLISNEAKDNIDILTWRYLIEIVARKLAISTLRVNNQINESSISTDDVMKLKKEIQERHQKVFAELLAARMKGMMEPDEARTPLLFNTDGAKVLQEMDRRKLRIEMAIHHWREWASNTEQMESFLEGLDDTHLAAIELPSNSARPITPGSQFAVEFKVRNSGIIPWPAGCYARAVWHHGSAKIRWFGDECTNILTRVVQPSEEVVLEVNPSPSDVESDNGSSGWTMVTPGGQDFGPMFWYRSQRL